jgi:hypothetical protein
MFSLKNDKPEGIRLAAISPVLPKYASTICGTFTAWATAFLTRTSPKGSFWMYMPIWPDVSGGQNARVRSGFCSMLGKSSGTRPLAPESSPPVNVATRDVLSGMDSKTTRSRCGPPPRDVLDMSLSPEFGDEPLGMYPEELCWTAYQVGTVAGRRRLKGISFTAIPFSTMTLYWIMMGTS